MENFSVIGFSIIVVVVFAVLKWSTDSEAKKNETEKESGIKLAWVAVISCLALLGLIVVMGGK